MRCPCTTAREQPPLTETREKAQIARTTPRSWGKKKKTFKRIYVSQKIGKETRKNSGDCHLKTLKVPQTKMNALWSLLPSAVRQSRGNFLQSHTFYSYLENSMDRGAWQATVHGFAESDMTEATQHEHMHLITKINTCAVIRVGHMFQCLKAMGILDLEPRNFGLISGKMDTK